METIDSKLMDPNWQDKPDQGSGSDANVQSTSSQLSSSDSCSDALLKPAVSFIVPSANPINPHLFGARTLDLAVEHVKVLEPEPGQDGFMAWYLASGSLPIISASLGPISNLVSIVALADKWRIPSSEMTGNLTFVHITQPADTPWVIGLNATSLVFGCAANLSLFLNFAGRVRYTTAQLVSIIGWYSASFLLLILIVVTDKTYFTNTPYDRSQGYFYAVLTCIMYFLSASFLCVNEIGYLRGHYGPTFNLSSSQRSIMLQNLLLITWLGLGSLLFQYLIDITYANALYYSIVTVLTIGLGDIVPTTTVGRALCLPFALIGVLFLGLIIATVRTIVLESGSQTMLWHRVERNRKKNYYRLGNPESDSISEQQSFDIMRHVHARAKRRGKWISVWVSVISFTIFWLLGAMVLSLVESWTYFEAIYFCSLCLLTIGYGDFYPITSAGRPFFVVWVLAAVPLMTILISNLGDTLFDSFLNIAKLLGARFLGSKREERLEKIRQKNQDDEDRIVEQDEQEAEEEAEEEVEEEEEEEEEEERKKQQAKDHDKLEGPVSSEGSNSSASTSGNQLPKVSKSSDTTPSHLEQLRNELKAATTIIEKDDIIIDDFKQRPNLTRDDKYLLDLLAQMNRILYNVIHEPDKVYDFEEWKAMMHLANERNARPNLSVSPAADARTAYWLSEDSPLRYPIHEPRYFFAQYFEAFEREILRGIHHNLDRTSVSSTKPTQD